MGARVRIKHFVLGAAFCTVKKKQTKQNKQTNKKKKKTGEE